MGKRKKDTGDGDLSAAISVVKGVPVKSALKHAGYSENMRAHCSKKALHSPRMQTAFKRLGLALVSEDHSEYWQIRGILDDRKASPGLVIETSQQLHDEWVKNGKKELPGLMELPEICRFMLWQNDSEGEDLSLIPAEQVTPEMIGIQAMRQLWKDVLDPPADARSRVQVYRLALEVAHIVGDRGDLHLHQHGIGHLSPQMERMLAEKMIEIQAEREQAAKNSEVIDAQIVTFAEQQERPV